MLLFKRIGLHVGRILNPSAVNEVRLGSVILKDEDINPHTMYINIYFLVMLVSILLVSLTGLSGEYSFAGSLAMLSNVGPSIGRMGTMGNYNWVPDTAKFLFTLDMFLGRVEIYPILAVMGMLLGLDNRK